MSPELSVPGTIGAHGSGHRPGRWKIAGELSRFGCRANFERHERKPGQNDALYGLSPASRLQSYQGQGLKNQLVSGAESSTSRKVTSERLKPRVKIYRSFNEA